jgi:trimethylamine---corrinoid protein Co-methyltransferase
MRCAAGQAEVEHHMRRKSQHRSDRQRDPAAVRQLPWRQVVNPYRPLEFLSADQVEIIHKASLKLLEDAGIEFMSPRALDVLAGAGAEVDRERQLVRFDRALVQELVALAPSSFTLTPRNPERRLTVGGKVVCFSTVGGPPNVHDCERGRRAGNLQDYSDFIRLAQSLNIVHYIGNQPCPPVELPAETRHLDCYLAAITYCDRIFQCTAIGAERAIDGIDMMAIARGLTRDEVADSPGILTNINCNSPRRYDGPMCEGLMAMADYGQGVVVTPFTLMGAMTPVTTAAALTQQNAEALAGIALTQAIRPGTPVVYGGFTSNVDMRSGAPAFGTPENARATVAGGQLARRYRLPYRSSNANASNAVDAQAAYESEMSIWSAVMGGANLLYHGVGWLEGGLTASFEKFVLDAELLQMFSEMLRPIEVDDANLALDAIGAVQPGGHFFGSPHTMERYETAFYEPLLSDWRNYETWEEAGSLTATQRATAIWKQLLKTYQQPPLDPAVAEELAAFVQRRKDEIERQAA